MELIWGDNKMELIWEKKTFVITTENELYQNIELLALNYASLDFDKLSTSRIREKTFCIVNSNNLINKISKIIATNTNNQIYMVISNIIAEYYLPELLNCDVNARYSNGFIKFLVVLKTSMVRTEIEFCYNCASKKCYSCNHNTFRCSFDCTDVDELTKLNFARKYPYTVTEMACLNKLIPNLINNDKNFDAFFIGTEPRQMLLLFYKDGDLKIQMRNGCDKECTIVYQNVFTFFRLIMKIGDTRIKNLYNYIKMHKNNYFIITKSGSTCIYISHLTIETLNDLYNTVIVIDKIKSIYTDNICL